MSNKNDISKVQDLKSSFAFFIFQAGPVVESILRSFPEYIKVKDLPHDDITYKVNHFHLLSLRFSLIAYYNAFVF